VEHAALLDAIGEALGLGRAYEELTGPEAAEHRAPSRVVLGGAAAGDGRVAWIEQRTEPAVGGFLPVEIDVRVAAGGALVGALEVATYNPYFGCHVEHAGWYGDAFIFVYREKHRTIAARIAPPFEEQALLALGGAVVVDGDALYWLDGAKVVRGCRLPSLAPTIAVPAPIDATRSQSLVAGDRPGIARVETWPESDELPEELDWEASLDERRALAQRSAVDVPLPPPEARLPAPAVVRRLLAAVARRWGVTANAADALVRAAAAPWLEEVAPPVPSYGLLPFASERLSRMRAAEHLDGVPVAPSAYGWPRDAATVEEALAQMFEVRVASLLLAGVILR